MGLKPDHWITKMALSHQMIEPFVEQQVREGVISYGLSSYGYDIRVANEFKIFQPEVTANKLSDVQCAYVAGAIDSLGEIDYTPPGGGHRSLQLRLVDHGVASLERLRELLGVGLLLEHGPEANHALVIGKPADVQHILAQTLPFLVNKRETAYRALVELKAAKSIVVDPKNFDADSFIDFRGDVCIIPPNSFALSRTVEYFRIPRSVLTICLGKSSYARCGIIVNVTPFEPEWEGFVTLEISNTTPLPAKIYANEGIAQVLFFEADEPCNVSYADRKGKYQRQQTIVLPKL